MNYLAKLKARWSALAHAQRLAVLLALTFFTVTLAGGFLRRDVIAANAYFCGVPIGGMSPEDAARVVSRKIEEVEEGSVVFVAGSRQVRVRAGEIQLVLDRASIGKQLDELTKEKPALVPGFVWKLGPQTVMAAPARVGNPDSNEVLSRIAEELSCPPLGSRYAFEGRDLVILPPEPGQVVTEQDVRIALSDLQGPVVNVSYVTIPAPSAVDLPQLVPLAEWSTRYDPTEEDRTTNLQLSARSIHGTVLQPGEVFSFNETVGPRTPERGYRYAPVVVGDRMQDDIGGGICQISTTLFNAAALAGMEFREWRNHGIPVQYADPGRDAAVAWGFLDLKIRNNLGGPVVFGVWVDGGVVVARVYGPGSPFHYELIPVIVEERPEPGKRPGLVVETYRVVKEGSTVVFRELLFGKKCEYRPSLEEGR